MQTQPGLFAQSPCSVNVVTPLLDRIKSELCVAAYTSLCPLLYWEHWGGVKSLYVQHEQNQDKFV